MKGIDNWSLSNAQAEYAGISQNFPHNLDAKAFGKVKSPYASAFEFDLVRA